MLVQTSTEYRPQWSRPVPIPAGEFTRERKKSAGLRVLVVDDEPLVRWSIAETLRGRDYEVLEAGDADSALRILLDGQVEPDAVLLDLRLPDCQDLRLLETLRLILPDAPVILMSAFGTPETTQQARELGAYAVLDKPFDLDTLDPLLAEAVR
jgi:DNA-binding NtrC family response regulator